MPSPTSDRLMRVVDALPLRAGMRVLEIGGAPGAAAREVAARVGPNGHVLVLDRSTAGIRRTRANCREEIAAGLVYTLCAPVEDFTLGPEILPFDLAFACRVGRTRRSPPQPVRPRPCQHRSSRRPREHVVRRHRITAHSHPTCLALVSSRRRYAPSHKTNGIRRLKPLTRTARQGEPLSPIR